MARASLKALSRLPLTVDELFESLDALSEQSNQAEAVIGAALIDDALKQAILSSMRENLSEGDLASVFENEAPLAGLSAKIRVAYALGIIGQKTRADLNCVRDIRNAFAHSKTSLKFDHPAVAAACATLGTPTRMLAPRPLDWASMEPRVQYRMTVKFVWILLIEESGHRQPLRTGLW